MKTKIKLIALVLFASLMGACSSSMQMSKTSRYQNDDLYYSPSTSYTVDNVDQNQESKQSSSASLKLAELERKYTEILANDTTGSLDTLIYKDERSLNPYERVLSDSYQDSYERRLRGFRNPGYGMNNWGVQYTDDYWYASAYDPSFYNIIVMGSDVWVEPRYISAMFGWPYFRSRIYYNSGSMYWGYGWYGMGYWSPHNRYYWGYDSWYSPWNSYAWGYNAGFSSGYNYGNYTSNANYHYGRRPSPGTVNYGDRPEYGGIMGINDRKRDLSDKQVTFNENGNLEGRGRSQGANGSLTNGQTPIYRPGKVVGSIETGNTNVNEVTRPGKESGSINNTADRPVRQDPPTRGNVTPADRVQGVVEPVRDRENNIVTRPSRESLNVNPTRVNPGDNRTSSTPTRDHNPSYTRPNPGNSNEFNRPTRNYPANETIRGGNRGTGEINSPARTPRQPSREYNPPPRTSPPEANPSRGRDTRGSSRPPASGSSSGSGSINSGSSGTSSSSGSSSSNTSSGSTGTRSR